MLPGLTTDNIFETAVHQESCAQMNCKNRKWQEEEKSREGEQNKRSGQEKERGSRRRR